MRPVAFLALLLCVPAAAEEPGRARKDLTVDALYDPTAMVDFAGTAPRGVTWLDETRLLWPKTDPRTKQTESFIIDAVTGDRRLLFDPVLLEQALARIPGVTADKAKDLAREKSYVLDRAGRSLVLEAGGDLYRLDLGS